MQEVKSLVFLSNFFNHHQQPASDAFFSHLGEGYLFIETEEMREERRNMNWGVSEYPSYVIPCNTFHENKAFYTKIIDEADVVIYGSAPVWLIKRRLKKNRLTFRYSERPLKKGLEIWKYPYRFFRWRMLGFGHRQHYLLCASAYAAKDYARFLLFKDRCYRWGYFPKTYRYEDIGRLISEKNRNSIIWVARFLDLKHPEAVIEAAKLLKRDGYDFRIEMIGNGELWDNMLARVQAESLEKEICLLGAITPEEVRTHMERSEIHIFTSDRNEGWGTVLNEAMNSACVPVANVQIGSAPYLIDNGRNGFVYSTAEELYEKLKYLLDNNQERTEMGKCAYETVVTEWNAEKAANRFLVLAQSLLNGDTDGVLYTSGVCSRAD